MKKITTILKSVMLLSLLAVLNSCEGGYNANEIPSGSTDRKEADEIYNGTTDAKKESVISDSKDTAQNQQMEPVNSTGGSTVTGTHQ
ncbi:MAG: hypothetical protein JWO32_1903 [Bacteroidetes bacterium]|nr:hypothetical protein [Bacteroidota bacterium]